MMAGESKRPGGELGRRPLHFIWIADCSGSMGGQGKIQALNRAINEAMPSVRQIADKNPHVDILMRAVRFESDASWHVGTPTDVQKFRWPDLTSGGETAMGRALELVADALKIPPMESRAMPPVLLMISDGQPTDDFEKGLAALMTQNWGKKAVRMAIAIGEDADKGVLARFIGNAEIPVLEARTPEALVHFIKLASTAATKSASAPASQGAGATPGGPTSGVVPIPTLDPTPPPSKSGDVW